MYFAKLIGSLFILFMIYYTYIHFKKHVFDKNIFLFWEILWVISLISIIYPQTLNPIVETFNFARTLDVMIVLGVMLVVGLSFQSYLNSLKMEKRLDKLVRKIAIENVKTKKNKK